MDQPKGGLIGKARTLARRVQQMNIPSNAADASYFLVLSVFPALVLMLSILRYTSLDAQDLMRWISGYLPRALQDAVEKLVIQTYAYSGVGMVSLSVVVALWSASKGVYGVLRGLNAIFGVEEDRGWLYTRGISLFYTFAFLVVLILSLTLNVFGEQILELIPLQGRFWRFLAGMVDMRQVLLLLLQTGLFTAMFMFMPNRNNAFRDSLPGAVAASLGWQIFTALFSVYVEHFAGYANVYGSVYAVALGMLWLYCCLNILFYGAALNQLLEEQQ